MIKDDEVALAVEVVEDKGEGIKAGATKNGKFSSSV